MNTAFAPGVQHTLLVPREFDIGDLIAWKDVSVREVVPDETTRCLWDFITLGENTVEGLPSFVRRWGLLDSSGESPASPGEDGAQSIEDWGDAAREVRELLVAIAMTEGGELLTESSLWELRGGDQRRYSDNSALKGLGGTKTPLEVYVLAQERQRKHYRDERRAGRGLELQREFIVNLLGDIAVPPEWRSHDAPPSVPLSFSYSWDTRGRRIEARACGVREIVSSHLLSLFGSTVLDVFVCSVCRKPFSQETTQAQRRPRKGVRRLCGEECRKEAKRASNRSSWNRHKDRWRRQPSSKQR